MSQQQMSILAAQGTVAPSTTVSLELPKAHYLGALDLHLNLAVTVTGGAITVVDASLGSIPLIRRVQLRLDGRTIPLSVRGVFLDYWSHVDRPGSERLALTGTASGSRFDSVLRYELAQSEANLTGAVLLSQYASARLEIEFNAVTTIATGTGVALSGTVDVYAELYDETKPIQVGRPVVHTLTEFTQDITAHGTRSIKLPKGRALERLVLVAENNSAYTWDLISDITFRAGPGDEPYGPWSTPLMRARNKRHYGGDDIPISGIYVLDLRRAGNRDIIPLGASGVAPEPELIIRTNSNTSLVSAQVHVVMEELEPVGLPAAA